MPPKRTHSGTSDTSSQVPGPQPPSKKRLKSFGTAAQTCSICHQPCKGPSGIHAGCSAQNITVIYGNTVSRILTRSQDGNIYCPVCASPFQNAIEIKKHSSSHPDAGHPTQSSSALVQSELSVVPHSSTFPSIGSSSTGPLTRAPLDQSLVRYYEPNLSPITPDSVMYDFPRPSSPITESTISLSELCLGTAPKPEEFAHESFAQKLNAHESFVQEPNAHDPNAHDPNAHEPNAHELFAHEPNAHEPNARDPPAQEPPAPQPNTYLTANHDTNTSAVLNQLGFIVNSVHRTLICTTCHVSVNHLDIVPHFKQKSHTTPKPIGDVQALLNEEIARILPCGLVYPPLMPLDIVDAVFGLAQPLRDALRCSECNRWYKGYDAQGVSNAFSTHKCAPPHTNPRVVIETAHVQQFFTRNGADRFPVRICEPPAPAMSTLVQYQLQRARQSVTEPAPPAVSENYRIFHQFLRKERWIEYLDPYASLPLFGLHTITLKDIQFPRLARHVERYLLDMQNQLNNYLVRRLIGKRPATEHEVTWVTHHADIDSSSVRKYSLVIAQAVALVLRNHQRLLPVCHSYHFDPPGEVTEAAENLISAFSQAPIDRDSDRPGEDDDADAILLDVTDDVFDDDEFEVPADHSQDFQAPAFPLRTPPSCATIQPPLRTLIRALYCQLPPPGTQSNVFDNVLIKFLVLASRKINGDWKNSSGITQLIAALTFGGRLSMYDRMSLGIAQYSDTTIHEQFKKIEHYFSENHEAVLPQLYLYHRGLAALRSADDQFYQFNAPDFQGNAIIVQGHTLYLSQLRDYVEALSVKIEAAIDELTFNLPQCKLAQDALVHDDPRVRNAEWGFVDHKDNPWAGEQSVLEHILTDPATFESFAFRAPDGDVVWKVGRCYRYTKEIFDVLMDICIAIVLTYGAPARASELLAHLLRNISGGSIRNVFVLFNVFILRGSYSKTAAATSSDKTMARVPLPVIGRSAIRHVAFLRGIFCEFQKVLHPQMVHNATHYLFSGFSRPVMTRDLSLMLSRLFKKQWGFKRMSVGEWRQIMAFIFQRNNLVFQQDELSLVADQMGHSQSMHNDHYGGDQSFPTGWNDHIFQSTALISAKYHMLLGFPPTLLQSLNAGRDAQTCILQTVRAIKQGSFVSPGQEVIVGQQTGVTVGAALTVPGVSHAIMRDVVPSIALHVNRAVAQGVATFANIAFPHHPAPEPSGAPTITRPPSVGLLVKLRECLHLLGEHRVNRGFTDRAQGKVAQLMWQGGVNIAYIAPTNAGKGLPAVLNAMIERGRLTTVYLIPLIAMQEQIILRSEQVGVTSGIWKSDMGLQQIPDNLIIVLETTLSEGFKLYIKQLYDLRRLARIVVDEAHLILAHSHFRPVMNDLAWVGTVGVPVIVQSATIPPSILPHLFAKLGVSVYEVCREPTPRPNIKYTVVTVPDATVEITRLWAEALSGTGKTLVFCKDKETVQQLSSRLRIPKCTGADDSADTKAVLSRLRAGHIRGIVCTIVLGVALDVPNIDLIIHYGCPYNMVGYSQETGRGGRSPDAFAKSVVILEQNHRPHNVLEPDYMGIRLMQHHVDNDTLCRNWMMSSFNDGVGVTCSMMSRVANLCDVCERQSSLPLGDQAIVEYSSDLIIPYLVGC